MLTFAAAIFFLFVTPDVRSMAGVGAAFGSKAGMRYLAGFFSGSNLMGLAILSGLTANLFAETRIRLILSMAASGSKIALIEGQTPPPSIGDGIQLQRVDLPNRTTRISLSLCSFRW